MRVYIDFKIMLQSNWYIYDANLGAMNKLEMQVYR